MDFSIVIPALNEKTRLPPFLLALAKKTRVLYSRGIEC